MGASGGHIPFGKSLEVVLPSETPFRKAEKFSQSHWSTAALLDPSKGLLAARKAGRGEASPATMCCTASSEWVRCLAVVRGADASCLPLGKGSFQAALGPGDKQGPPSRCGKPWQICGDCPVSLPRPSSTCLAISSSPWQVPLRPERCLPSPVAGRQRPKQGWLWGHSVSPPLLWPCSPGDLRCTPVPEQQSPDPQWWQPLGRKQSQEFSLSCPTGTLPPGNSDHHPSTWAEGWARENSAPNQQWGPLQLPKVAWQRKMLGLR